MSVAKITADDIRALIEEVRVNKREDERIENENKRQENEQARQEAESEREAAESARAAAEAQRVLNENARQSAESSRASAESGRVSAESSRVSAENARAAAESARASAEADRVSAENARVAAESARASAESSRVSAEALRVDAENARVSAEAARAQAEADREAAEAQRQQDTADAISAANDATSAANSAASNANSAASTALNAASNANSAADAANQAVALVQDAIEEAEDATSAANNAANNANNAASLANNAASNANNAADAANNLVQTSVHRGEYDPSTQYYKNNHVRYNGSTWRALQDVIGQTPTEGVYWTLVAQRGLDGEGSVQSVNGKLPDLSGNITLTATDVGAETPTGAQSKADTAEANAKAYADDILDNLKPEDIGAASETDFASHVASSVHIGKNPYCRIRASANQTISHNAIVKLSLDTAVNDPYGMHDSMNRRIVVPETGVYLIVGIVAFAAETLGERQAIIMVNSMTVAGRYRGAPNPGPNPTMVGVSVVTSISAGDYIELYASQGSGASLDVLSLGVEAPVLSVVRVA